MNSQCGQEQPIEQTKSFCSTCHSGVTPQPAFYVEDPADWCESFICPIYKSGSNREPQNYRGISLMNNISKVFNGILTARVQKWTEENNVLDESQARF